MVSKNQTGVERIVSLFHIFVKIVIVTIIYIIDFFADGETSVFLKNNLLVSISNYNRHVKN